MEEAQALSIGSVAAVKLPEGWTYERSRERLKGISPDAGATLAFTVAPGTSREAVRSAIYALFADLSITGVIDAAIDLDQPHAELPSGELVVQAWQVEKPKRGKSVQKEDPTMSGEAGALLVGVTRVSDADTVVGVGFLLRSAPTAHAHALKGSLTSLRAATATATAIAGGEGS